MKILFIGGTGFISSAVSRQVIARGWDLYLLNRGTRSTNPPGCHSLVADVHQPAAVAAALGDLHFDAVVDWIAYTPDDIERDLALFRCRTRQYVFISSASAYQKPPRHYLITESTPLENPFWEYSRSKIEAEARLMRAWQEENFPATIVRPSLTYDFNFPVPIGSKGCYTLADRIKNGRPIVVHGDGTSLWVLTHAEDFGRGLLGLLGNEQALGEAFHITSDEVLTWNEIYQSIAEGIGTPAKIVHIPSDFIAQVAPRFRDGLYGDKMWSTVFDNSKIKKFVPDFQATIPFREGVRRTLAWFAADKNRMRIDDAVNAEMDRILQAYQARG